MKILLLPVLMLVFSASTYPVESELPGMKPDNPPTNVIAKPAMEITNSGLHMKVWMMSVIRGIGKGIINQTDDVEESTHHVMVELRNEENGMDIPNAMVKLDIESPSGKKSSVELDEMFRNFGGNINFVEKGEYQLNLSITTGGRTISSPFSYKVV